MTDTNYPSPTPQPEMPKAKSDNRKNIIIGILAAGLLGSWGYFKWDSSKSGEKIDQQKTQIVALDSSRSELQLEFDNALARLDSVTGVNNSIQDQLTEREKEIAAQKSEIRKILNDRNATKADLAKATAKIASLNKMISGYEMEIARLKGENDELTSANLNLKQENADLEQNLNVNKKEKAELENTVDVGSTFAAFNIQVTPVNEKGNGKEKNTTTAKKVDKMVVSFDVENRIAKSGPADLYLIVTAPDGKVISSGGNVLTTRNDGDKPFTARISINYDQGTRKSVQFPVTQDNFSTGNYKIEIYHNGFKIGDGVRSLKKGGIFG